MAETAFDDPALVHLAPSQSGPGTHVLILGIGYYHHLPGGMGAPLKSEHSLEQLGSPPLSARALADWFMTEFDNPEKPLMSLGLVISEPEPARYTNSATGQTYMLPSGNAAEVKASILAWASRASETPDNSTIFYFCGHGVSRGYAEALLLRDYGANAISPFDGAMDLASFKMAMQIMPPDNQVFFIDACRTGTLNTADISHAGLGQRMLQPDNSLRIGRGLAAQSVHYATFEGTSAFGADDSVSLFTHGLLKALRTAGQPRAQGDWWVETFNLQKQIGKVTSRLAARGKATQQPEAHRCSSIYITRLPDEPAIPVYVSCKPSEVMASAILTCRSDGNMVCQDIGPRPQGVLEWETALNVGRYDFEAMADGRVGRLNNNFVAPPVHEVEIPIASAEGSHE